MKRIVAAILGYGIVGQGVGALLTGEAHGLLTDEGLDVELRYCLDRGPVPDLPLSDRIVTDPDIIFNDPEIDIVCETMGGVTDSYTYTKRALSAGVHVVTSNKALVAKHGQELLRLAAENGVRYLYEAAVGGGIPLLRNLRSSFPSTQITRVAGVLNGTSNYILTQMAASGTSFNAALSQAQDLGFAERDPSDDVEGTDSARKIAIIGSLLTASAIPTDAVRIWGINHLNEHVFDVVNHLGLTLRHVALFEMRGDKRRYDLMVAPMLLPADHSLAVARGVGNAVEVRTSQAGDYLFAGPGAGGLATASALVADVLSCFSQEVGKSFIERWDQPVDSFLTDDLQRPCRALLLAPSGIWKQVHTEAAEHVRQRFTPILPDYPDEGLLIMQTPQQGYTEKQLAEDLQTLAASNETEQAEILVLRYLAD